jgi:hypothetical protein
MHEFGVDDPRGDPFTTNRALVMARGVNAVNLDRAFSPSARSRPNRDDERAADA